MKGTVFRINPQTQIVAVETQGDFSIFQLMGGGNLDLGDQLGWKDDTVFGQTMLTNLTRNERFEVNFKNHHVHLTNVNAQLKF